MNEIIPSKSKVQIWQERIAVHAQTGQSIRIFCEENRISYYTFQYWKRKFKNLHPASLTNKFVSLSSELSSLKAMRNHFSAESPRIHLPNGVKIELGGSLESVAVNQFLQKLCGVGHPPKDACPPVIRRGHSAKS